MVQKARVQPSGFREGPAIWEVRKQPPASLPSAGGEARGGGEAGPGEQPLGVVGDRRGEVHQADGLCPPGQNISGAGTGFRCAAALLVLSLWVFCVSWLPGAWPQQGVGGFLVPGGRGAGHPGSMCSPTCSSVGSLCRAVETAAPASTRGSRMPLGEGWVLCSLAWLEVRAPSSALAGGWGARCPVVEQLSSERLLSPQLPLSSRENRLPLALFSFVPVGISGLPACVTLKT